MYIINYLIVVLFAAHVNICLCNELVIYKHSNNNNELKLNLQMITMTSKRRSKKN